jgi:hypothetical protein
MLGSMGSSLLVQQTNYKTMTMRTVPTKEGEGVEDSHGLIVKQIQRGRRMLRFE